MLNETRFEKKEMFQRLDFLALISSIILCITYYKLYLRILINHISHIYFIKHKRNCDPHIPNLL